MPTRAPNGSGQPAGNSRLTLTLRVQIGSAGGADSTRPDRSAGNPQYFIYLYIIYIFD